MAQLLVRKISEASKEKLRNRARMHGRSMEEEARVILDAALAQPDAAGAKFGWASRFIAERGATFTEDEADALELRGQPIRPAEFD